MRKSDALIIDNRAGIGVIGVSKPALVEVVAYSLDRVPGIKLKGAPRRSFVRSKRSPALKALLSAPGSIRIVFKRDGGIKVFASIVLPKLITPEAKVEAAKAAISDAIALATDGIIPEVKIIVHRRG